MPFASHSASSGAVVSRTRRGVCRLAAPRSVSATRSPDTERLDFAGQIAQSLHPLEHRRRELDGVLVLEIEQQLLEPQRIDARQLVAHRGVRVDAHVILFQIDTYPTDQIV